LNDNTRQRRPSPDITLPHVNGKADGEATSM
jgi:hypothetical protein